MSILVGRSEIEVAEEAVAYQEEQLRRRRQSVATQERWLAEAIVRLAEARAEGIKPYVSSRCCAKYVGCVCDGGRCPEHGGPGCTVKADGTGFGHD